MLFFESKSLLLLLLFLLVELIITKILDLFPPVFFSEFCGLCRRLKLQFYVNNSASAESHNKKTWSMTLRGKTVGKTSGTQEDKRKKKKRYMIKYTLHGLLLPICSGRTQEAKSSFLAFCIYAHIYTNNILHIYYIDCIFYKRHHVNSGAWISYCMIPCAPVMALAESSLWYSSEKIHPWHLCPWSILSVLVCSPRVIRISRNGWGPIISSWLSKLEA